MHKMYDCTVGTTGNLVRIKYICERKMKFLQESGPRTLSAHQTIDDDTLTTMFRTETPNPADAHRSANRICVWLALPY